MTAYILDTNTLSDFFRFHPVVVGNVFYHLGDGVTTTTVTFEEQLNGWFQLLRAATTPDQIERASVRMAEAVRQLASWPALPYGGAAVARYTQLLRRHLNVRKNDLRIAAIALEAGGTVVSANAVDFSRVPGLSWVDWTKPQV